MQSITLQTSDTVVTSGDKLGQLNFAAPAESDGSAAILVAGSVYVQAEGSFQSSSNPTSIVFATAAADASSAVSRLKVNDEGHLLPLSTETYDLGSNSSKFRNIYAQTIDIDTLTGDLDATIVVECRNDTGSTINAGVPVYISGYYSSNGKALIAPAVGNDSTKMPAIGLLQSTLTDGSEGYVDTFGQSTGFDTSSFTVGETVYVDPTGGLTNTRPTGVSELVQNMGRVLRSDASQGRVLVLGPGRTNDTPNSGEYQYLNVENYITVSGERVVSSETIHHIKQLTQAEYDAITPDSATFYIITDAAEDAAVSGYFETRVDAADASIIANSGYFESRVDTNATDIATVSGLLSGSSYTAGSGLTLVGSEFNVYGGSGNFRYAELTASNEIPTFKYLGSGATDTPINLEVRSSFQSATGSGTALLFQGTQGQLFSITDNLSSGTIFNVSDITGLPMLEVTASGDVEIGEFADNITIHQPVLISGGVPSSTTNKLYNNAGTLYFNGSALGTLSNIVEDTTPQLGGTLDANGNTIDMGTNTITDTKVGQWDTAYSWGDHSSAGYVTLTGVQTLTNKTLNSPNIVSGVFQDTFTIGSQIFYEQGTNGFSVNEDFDPSNSSTQTAYHFTTGSGRETLAFTLARTSQFTDGFGIYGTSSDNTFVTFGEQSNTNFEWRKGIGIRPLDLDGGTLLMRLDVNGNLDVSGSGIFGSGISIGGTAITATAGELNYVDGVTSNIQTQLDAKAAIASPTFTGTPAAPTAAAGTNTTQIATTAYVTTAISNLVDGAPTALDTLNELAAALNDDANIATTLTNLITSTSGNLRTDIDLKLENIVEDTTPQLGGTLDANGNSIDMGTNTITDTKVGQWDTAYGWGDHASAGYSTTDTTYTAGSGLTLVGTEFNIHGGSGLLNELQFPSGQPIVIRKSAGEASYKSIYIGSEAGEKTSNGDGNIAIGYQAQKGGDSTSLGVAIGLYAMTSTTNADAFNTTTACVAIGSSALYESNSCRNTVAIGDSAGWRTSDSDYTVFIGSNTGKSSVDLNYGNVIGAYAGISSSGNYNIGMGYLSLRSTTGSYNSGFGYQSLRSVTGDNNIEIVTQGASSSIIGTNSNKIHIENTIIGDTSSKLLAIGNVTSSDLTPDATLEIKPNATTDIGLIVQAVASHSASLQEWQNSSETKLLAVGPDGGIEFPNNTPSTTTNKLYSNGTNLKFGSQYVIDSSNVNTGLQYQPLAGGLNVVGLTVSEFATSAIVTASEGIGSNNNDTTIPTSAAVKAYADSVAGGGGISNVVEDTTPQLGGDLDTNHKKISFPGNIILDSTFVEGFVSASGSVHIGERAAINSATDMFSDVMIGKGAGADSDRYEQTGFLTFNYSNNIYIGRHAGSGSQQGYAINIGDGAGVGTDMVATNVNGLVGNIAIGQNACRNESRNGSYYGGNVAVGTSALDTAYNTESAVALGYFALYDAKYCGYSVAVGRGALQEAWSAGSVAVGRSTLESTSGDYNTAIGYYAGYNLDGSNNIEIRAGSSQAISILNGYDDKITIRGDSNSVFVGDLSSRLFAIGNVGVADITPDATLEIKPASTTDTGLIVQAAASQTATLQEWQNSSETKLLAVGPDGGLELPSNVPSTTTNKLYNDGGTLKFNGSSLATAPGGSDTYIQFNDGGSFGGDADLVWNKTTNALTINGSLNATTKSFLIDHPSKPGMKLQYASLEGPENGVYVRGTTDSGTITLPDYWRDLVHNGSITVTLTPVGQFQPLFVEQKSNREIRVGGVCGYYDYVVYGERKDVDKLEVEW